MASPALKLNWVILVSLSLSTALSLSPPNNANLTLSGDAHFINTSVSLTTATSSSLNCSSTSIGSAFYPYPIRFFDPATNSTNSFSSLFSFRILSLSSSCPFGDGIAFIIASKTDLPETRLLINGYMGIQEPDPDNPFLAIEFDTSYDANLGDFSSSHVGLDLNSVVSIAAVDFLSLRSGRQLTAWIEYHDPEKTLRVWVGFSTEEKPKTPLIEYHIDLSRQFNGFIHVGFSASNPRGSALHLIDMWRFRISGPVPSVMPMETVENSDCLMCYPGNDTEGQTGLFNHMDKTVSELAFVLGGLAASIIAVCSVICIFILCIMRKRKLTRRRVDEYQISKAPKRLSLSEIRSATKGFNHKRIIGEGGTATVYEGVIPSLGPVAVKRFTRLNQTSPFRNQFSTEFATMVGFLKHKHLVPLQGWCCEGNELVLVYEFMSNGSLDKVLHSNNAMSGFLMWERRLNILLGVGSALIYLHEQCERQIIHRDVKTCNIMLDDEFNAKLGDFGLAEVYNHSSVLREATIPAGTVGYLAPEYVYTGIPTVKTDVYSYGVVVLEVVTGQKPVVENGVMLADRMWDMWEKGRLIEAVDLKLRGKFKRSEVERVLMVGLCCVHPDFEERPTVREAVRMVRGEMAVPVLPRRKPTVRIQSVLPEGSREIMSLGGDENVEETPWLTPRTHFECN